MPEIEERKVDKAQREVLPAPDQRYQGLITYDAKDRRRSFRPFPRFDRRGCPEDVLR